MQSYIEKSTIEKIALSPSFTVGFIAGTAKGIFNRISGKSHQQTANTHLFENQSIVDSVAGGAYVPVAQGLGALSLSSLTSIWTPAALMVDCHRKDDNGKGFGALKAGYQAGLTLNSYLS